MPFEAAVGREHRLQGRTLTGWLENPTQYKGYQRFYLAATNRVHCVAWLRRRWCDDGAWAWYLRLDHEDIRMSTVMDITDTTTDSEIQAVADKQLQDRGWILTEMP